MITWEQAREAMDRTLEVGPPLDLVPDIQELSAAKVEKLLVRRSGWARAHITELGGYCDGGRYRFPVHGIRRWQEEKAAEYAQRRDS